MKSLFAIACAAGLALLAGPASAQRAQYEAMVARHAKANGVPEALVHRVIVRESKYQPRLIGRGGALGMMQIKLATARSLGYSGDAEELLDANTNLTYAVKYLAGAWRLAHDDHDRAVHYYAAGYYYEAKRQRLEDLKHPAPVLASAAPKEPAPKEQEAEASPPRQAESEPAAAVQETVPVPKAAVVAKPAKPKRSAKKLANMAPLVIRPPLPLGSSTVHAR